MKLNETESIRIVDSHNNLNLYHYSECDSNSSDNRKSMRGTIIDSVTGKTVMQSFPYTQEIVWEEGVHLPFIGKRNRYFTSVEGTIIRVFHHNGTWFTSTHKRINSYTSRWGGPISFGEFFQQAVEIATKKPFNEFFTLLNPEHQYIFLLYSTVQTRIVTPGTDYPIVSLIATVINDKFVFDTNLPGFFSQYQLRFDASVSEDENVKLIINDYNNSLYAQGLFVVSEDENGITRFYKVLTPLNSELVKLRGNTFDIGSRYLEIRTTPKVAMFTDLYREHMTTFMFIESQLGRIVHIITSKYIERFVKGRYAPVHRMLYPFMKYVREHTMKNNCRVNTMVVWRCLVEQQPSYLLKMIYAGF